jgi:hypothetical protein
MSRMLFALLVLSLTPHIASAAEQKPTAVEATQALDTFRVVIDAMRSTERPPADGASLLKEVLRSGSADPATFGTIAAWVMHEREENVAQGFSEVLEGLDLTGKGKDAERWNATTRAVVNLITASLRDARANRRQSSVAPELEALLHAAVPAIAATLQEVDPGTRDALAKTVRDALAGLEKPTQPEKQ